MEVFFFIIFAGLAVGVVGTVLGFFGVLGLVWGKIFRYRIVYLSSATRLYKTFAIVDKWGDVRAPEDFGASNKWLTLRADGTIIGSYEYEKWRWAHEEKTNEDN